ncbi:chemotaxis protein CheW [Melioribacteraceae bacterium 4301-Me]|uniref:chemotaxis protein CheW n=1 Tax=Pyranulibacter aquaticus TaxID=3163344 RepID=UPI00359897F3
MEMNDSGKNKSSEILQLVSFRVNKEEYAIDILKVKEIIKVINITQVPNTDDFIEGVINLRGSIIPVVALRTKLGMPKKEPDKDTRIIVVEIDDKVIGFIVDAVNEVLRISSDLTEKTPEFISNVNMEFISSVAKLENRLLILLDLNKIFSKKEKHALENAA